MPDEWQIRFTNGEVRTDMPEFRQATDDELAQCLTDGAMCLAVTKALNKFRDLLTVQARHDSALKDRDGAMPTGRTRPQGRQHSRG